MSDVWQKLHKRCDAPDADLIHAESDAEIVDVMREACEEIEQLRSLNQRALAIITEALMHGMPITEEIAAVRNEIVGLHKEV